MCECALFIATEHYISVLAVQQSKQQ